jgi:hypothetical protein
VVTSVSTEAPCVATHQMVAVEAPVWLCLKFDALALLALGGVQGMQRDTGVQG